MAREEGESRFGVSRVWPLMGAAGTSTKQAGTSADALRKTKDNTLVICTAARIFWSERKIEKGQERFGRALA